MGKKLQFQQPLILGIAICLMLSGCTPGNSSGLPNQNTSAEDSANLDTSIDKNTEPFIAETDGPPGFDAALSAPDVVLLTWEPVEAATGYELQIDDLAGGFFTIAHLPSNAVSYEDLMAPADFSLTYRLQTITDDGSGGASTLQIDTLSPQPNPLSVVPNYDMEAAVSATIGADGGSVVLTDTRGLEFLFEIPAGAVLMDTEFQLIPVTSIGDWPLDGESLAAVRIEPEGLRLFGAATLTISLPAQTDPSLAIVGYAFDGTGEDFYLRPVSPGQEATAFYLGSSHLAVPALQAVRRIVLPVIELNVHGVGQSTPTRAADLVKNSSPSTDTKAANQKQAASAALDELTPLMTLDRETDPGKRAGNEILRSLTYLNTCEKLAGAVERMQEWQVAQNRSGQLASGELQLRERAMKDQLVKSLKEQLDRLAEECEKGAAGSKSGAPCLLDMVDTVSASSTPFWTEIKAQMGSDYLDEINSKLDQCRTHYQALEIPGGSRTWQGACFDNLLKMIDIRWIGGSDFGIYRIIPRDANSGKMFDSWHLEAGGTTMDYAGVGRYTIEVTRKDANENVIEIDIIYKTNGTAQSCTGGFCSSFSLDTDEARIPVSVSPGRCPQE